MKQKLTLAVFAASLIVHVWFAFDVQFTHYEDGSGKITWCVPAGECAK